MSAPMKKRPTKKAKAKVEVQIGEIVHVYTGIPQTKVKPILTLLKDYEDTDELVPWRDLASGRIAKAGGEAAYMVKTARKKAGFTQVELAEKLNMPQSNLSQIENGKRSVGKVLAKKLSAILKIDYRAFL